MYIHAPFLNISNGQHKDIIFFNFPFESSGAPLDLQCIKTPYIYTGIWLSLVYKLSRLRKMSVRARPLKRFRLNVHHRLLIWPNLILWVSLRLLSFDICQSSLKKFGLSPFENIMSWMTTSIFLFRENNYCHHEKYIKRKYKAITRISHTSCKGI